MRIVFLGSSEFGLPTLELLATEGVEVPLIITQPDRPKGRKRVMSPTPVGAWAAARGIDCIKPENVNDATVLDHIRALDIDAMVVIAYGQYLKQRLVTIPRLGAMNLHASILPHCRGAAPIQWSIIRDEPTGNTIMRIAKKMDAGDVLATQPVPVGETETAGELHDRLAEAGAPLVVETLKKLDAGEIEETPQDHDQATHAPKLSGRDAWVDFSENADAVRRRINGLSPYPGVRARIEAGGDMVDVKMLRAGPASGDGEPGRVIDAEAGVVGCGDGAVRLIDVQPPGKTAMPWSDFLHGHAVGDGARVVCDVPDR